MLLFCFTMEAQAQNNHTAVSPPDEELLMRLGSGDMDAFRLFYEGTNRAVYGFLLSILKNHHDAEDCMQDTYLKIRAAAPLYQPQGKPMAWVLTIARNLALMKLRSVRHSVGFSWEDMENEPSLPQTDSEDRLVLETALHILNEEERQIVILHAVTGWKHREISLCLDLSLSTVLSKYSRALGKLKKFLEEGAKQKNET